MTPENNSYMSLFHRYKYRHFLFANNTSQQTLLQHTTTINIPTSNKAGWLTGVKNKFVTVVAGAGESTTIVCDEFHALKLQVCYEFWEL